MEKFAGNSQNAKNSQDEGRPLQLLHKPESLGHTVHSLTRAAGWGWGGLVRGPYAFPPYAPTSSPSSSTWA